MQLASEEVHCILVLACGNVLIRAGRVFAFMSLKPIVCIDHCAFSKIAIIDRAALLCLLVVQIVLVRLRSVPHPDCLLSICLGGIGTKAEYSGQARHCLEDSIGGALSWLRVQVGWRLGLLRMLAHLVRSLPVGVGDVGHLGAGHLRGPVAPGREDLLGVKLSLGFEVAGVILLHEVLLDRFAVKLVVVCWLLNRASICQQLRLERASLLLLMVQFLCTTLQLYVKT